MTNIWRELEIAATADRDAIRRAYARKLKRTNPEDDPAGFKRLREAYEIALRQAQWRHKAQSDAETDDAEPEPEAEAADAIAPAFVGGPAGSRPQWQEAGQDAADAELRAVLAQDRAELEARFAALTEALSGPWGASERDVAERFDQLLKAPALIELGAREQIEQRIAALATETVPRGDALIDLAGKRFGWFRLDPGLWHGPALAGVLRRIEEWRIVEQLGRADHPLHAGWHALTTEAGPYWAWWLDAFRPSLARQVRTLLGLDGTDVAEGLRHSFRQAAVQRWQAYLAKPRLTLAMLSLIPLLLALTAAGIFATGGPDRSGALPIALAGGLVALVSPTFPLFAVARWRARWQARAADRATKWLAQGWIGGFVVLAAASAPVAWYPWAAVGVIAGAGAVAVWVGIVHRDLRSGRKARWTTALYFLAPAFITLPATATLPAALQIAGVTLIVCALYVRAVATDDLGDVLGGWSGANGWIVPIAALLLALGVPVLFAGVLQLPNRLSFYFYLLLALPLLLTLAASVLRTADRGLIVTHRVARIVIILALMLLAPYPPAMRTAGLVPTQSETPAPTLDQQMARALTTPDSDSALLALEHARPGFSEIADANSILRDQIKTDLDRYYAPGAHLPAGMTIFAIQLRIIKAYRTNMKFADDGLLAEEARVEQARMIERQAAQPESCALPISQIEDGTLSPELRARVAAQIFNLAAVPFAESPPLSSGSDQSLQILHVAAGMLGISEDQMYEVIDHHDGRLACDAHVTVLRLLTSYPTADVAATLRANPDFVG